MIVKGKTNWKRKDTSLAKTQQVKPLLKGEYLKSKMKAEVDSLDEFELGLGTKIKEFLASE